MPVSYPLPAEHPPAQLKLEKIADFDVQCNI